MVASSYLSLLSLVYALLSLFLSLILSLSFGIIFSHFISYRYHLFSDALFFISSAKHTLFHFLLLILSFLSLPLSLSLLEFLNYSCPFRVGEQMAIARVSRKMAMRQSDNGSWVAPKSDYLPRRTHMIWSIPARHVPSRIMIIPIDHLLYICEGII